MVTEGLSVIRFAGLYAVRDLSRGCGVMEFHSGAVNQVQARTFFELTIKDTTKEPKR